MFHLAISPNNLLYKANQPDLLFPSLVLINSFFVCLYENGEEMYSTSPAAAELGTEKQTRQTSDFQGVFPKEVKPLSSLTAFKSISFSSDKLTNISTCIYKRWQPQKTRQRMI